MDVEVIQEVASWRSHTQNRKRQGIVMENDGVENGEEVCSRPRPRLLARTREGARVSGSDGGPKGEVWMRCCGRRQHPPGPIHRMQPPSPLRRTEWGPACNEP